MFAFVFFLRCSSRHCGGFVDGRDLQVGHDRVDLRVQVLDLLEALLGPLVLAGAAPALHSSQPQQQRKKGNEWAESGGARRVQTRGDLR